MTIAEFESYLQKGLGRAILLLRQETDKTPFREAAMHYLSQGHQPYELYEYDLDLLSSFEDHEDMVKELAERILDALRKQARPWNLPLLKALGYQKEITRILKEQYREAWEGVQPIAKVDRPSPEQREAHRRYNTAVMDLATFCDVSKDEALGLFADLIAFFGKRTEPVDSHVLSVVCHDLAPLWNHDKDAMLQEIEALEGGTVLWRQILLWEPLTPDPDIRADFILLHLPQWCQNPFARDSRVSFNFCAESLALAAPVVVEEIAGLALKTTDPKEKNHLFQLFLRHWDADPTPFPFPERLIAYFDDKTLALLEEFGRSRETEHLLPMLDILIHLRHPQVAALGKRMRCHPRTAVSGWAIMGRNYTDEDREELYEALTKEYPEDDSMLTVALSALFRSAAEGREGLPIECLPPLWDRVCGDPMRCQLAKVLHQYGIMTDHIREECRYDRFPEIRTLVRD